MFPMVESVKSRSPIQSGISTLLGITNSSLLGVTPNANNAAANPSMLPSHTSTVTMPDMATPALAAINEGITLETVTSEVATAHPKHLQTDYPSTVTRATTKEQTLQVNDNLSIAVDNAVIGSVLTLLIGF